MELNEQEHQGCVKSSIHHSCLVAEAVEVSIEGKSTGLSLMDAQRLLAGLAEAVARVEENEKKLLGSDGLSNVAILAPTRSGMSFPRTKLGQGGIVFLDCMPGTDMNSKLLDKRYQDGCGAEFLVVTPASGQ